MWWEIYGINADPMTNNPVPRESRDLLVMTKPLEDLRGYLCTDSKRGGIYLLTGSYGSGKTSALNAISLLLAETTSITIFYHDISRYKTLEELGSFFRKVIAQEAAKAFNQGTRPAFALDQLHNLDTGVAESFFKTHQVAFEALKDRGVRLVFAGDDRFSSLVRSGGPLGAIFDKEFPIPPFEEGLAEQLLLRRMKDCAVSPDFRFPIVPEAVALLVKLSEGNPRRLVDLTRRVLEFASVQSPPVSVRASDVLSATAEVTEDRLLKIRSELKSPSVNNSLAKMVRIRSKAHGHEKIHELARLLDLVLEQPDVILEEALAQVKDLKLKPEVIIDTANEAGLTETELKRVKLRYGVQMQPRTKLTRPAFKAIATIRDQAGLQPSQYLDRITEESIMMGSFGHGDLLLADLLEAQKISQNERARSFLERACKMLPSLDHTATSDEQEVLSVLENSSKGLRIQLIGDGGKSTAESVKELWHLANLSPEEAEKLSTDLERWEELRTLYEDRGLVWDDRQGRDARNVTRSVLRSLLEILLNRSKENSRVVGFSQEDLSALANRIHDSFKSLGVRDDPERLVGKLEERFRECLPDLPGFSREGFARGATKCLCFLDKVAYVNLIENNPAFLSSSVAGILEVFARADSPGAIGIDRAIADAGRFIGFLGEQGRVLVGKLDGETVEPASLSSVVKKLLKTSTGRNLHSRAEVNRTSATDISDLNALLRDAIGQLRGAMTEPELVDASLVVWYLLRNTVSHTVGSLGSIGVLSMRKELARTFAISTCELAVNSVPAKFGTRKGFIIVRTPLTSHLFDALTDGGVVVAVGNEKMSGLNVCLATTSSSAGVADVAPWRIQKHITRKDVSAGSRDWIESLPIQYQAGFAILADPDPRIRFGVFRADRHRSDGSPITLHIDKQAGGTLVKRILPDESNDQSRKWIASLADKRLFFLGALRPRSDLSRDADIVPLIEGSKNELIALANKLELGPLASCA